MRMALLAGLLILSFSGIARAADFSVGQEVFYKDGAKAHVGPEEIDIGLVPFPATIEVVQGNWLWVGRAWLHKRDVNTADQALTYYSAQIRRRPSPRAHVSRGAVWLSKGELEKAIDDCNEAIKLDPTQAKAYYVRAKVAFQNGNFGNAIKDCTEAIRLDPTYADAYCGRGATLATNGELDNAIKDYTEAITIDPNCPKAYCGRGGAWATKGDLDNAIKDFTEAIRLDPKYADAYCNRGTTLTTNGDLDGAIKDYTEAITIDPNRSEAYCGRGSAWALMGDHNNAITDFSEAIRLNPKYAQAHCNRGSAHAMGGWLDHAVKDYREAVKIDPACAIAYKNLAWLMATSSDAQFRDGNEAVSVATKACELTGWKESGSIGTLAAAYAEQGDFDNAVKWQREAIGLATEKWDKQIGGKRLELYEARKPYRKKAKN
jgi:tetratricopeptide (TPR) repeat protein